MREIRLKITDESGFHARPAGLIAHSAKNYSSQIHIKCEDSGRSCVAVSPVGIMTLGAVFGNIITVTIDGTDENAAYDGMLSILSAYGTLILH